MSVGAANSSTFLFLRISERVWGQVTQANKMCANTQPKKGWTTEKVPVYLSVYDWGFSIQYDFLSAWDDLIEGKVP